MTRHNIREILANPESKQQLLEGAARAIVAVGRDDTHPVEGEPMKPKNPYRALAEKLRALPEEQHMLLSQRLSGVIGSAVSKTPSMASPSGTNSTRSRAGERSVWPSRRTTVPTLSTTSPTTQARGG